MIGRLTAGLSLLAALGGCAASDPLNTLQDGVGYRNVAVGSGSASAFYYIPADAWTALAADDGARMQAMLGDHSFSAVKPNTPVKMTLGQRYLVIPVCAGQPRPDRAIRPVIEDQKTLEVEC
ncbi:hypothetical protein ACO2Q3_23040 [Caulobacter sp. KR2-114]|uniref:hypothetical protein n=1 Tax=Caulobacter sp. KR2-114 TaxID=3400912 RepID=UPI003C03BFF4